ncbi:MAG: AAA family ATPase, partial [Leptospiraceae bacterium]|nr:AAA family ATPase [Leptospiraceae bacterium]
MEEHITYFKIENFKRFESLEVENIGQFNLIVGDNNVGKSSLLEALLFEGDAIDFIAKVLVSFIQKYDIMFLNTFFDQINRQGVFEYFKIFFNLKLKLKEIKISIVSKDKFDYLLSFEDTKETATIIQDLPVFGASVLGGGITIHSLNYKRVVVTLNNRKLEEMDLNPTIFLSKINDLYYI